MKLPARSLVLWVLSALLGSATANEMPVKVLDLTTSSGISYSYVELPEAKSVSIFAAWRTNWPENGRQPAAPYVGTELMFSGGAGERDAATIGADFQAIDGKAELIPAPHFIRAYLGVGPDDIDEAAGIASDVITAPMLDARWFARIKTTQASNLQQNLGMQSNLASRLIHNMVFSPAPIVGTFSLAPEKLSTLDLDTVRIWQQETFHRGNLSVAAAGPLPAARMTEVIEQMFGKLPSGPAVAKAASVAATTPAKLVLLHTPTVGKSVVSIAGRLPALRAEPEIEVFFATMALSDGESSRLNAAVRGDLRASYGMQAGVSNLTHEHRLLMFEGEIEGPKIKPALTAIRNAYENLRLNGLTQEEFEAIRGKILTYIRAARNQPDFIASSMLEAKLSGMPITKGLNLLDNISAMTRDHVNRRIARDFPAFDAMVKIVVTPDEKAVTADCVVQDPDAFQPCLK